MATHILCLQLTFWGAFSLICGAFSFMWPGSMQIYWNKRKRLNKKRVQLPQDCLGTPTWPPFHCFGTPIWPPWCHVKTLYKCTEPFNATWPRCLTTTFFWPFQEQFCDYMFQQAIKNEWKAITENKSKFILVSQKAWNKGKILLLDSLSDCVFNNYSSSPNGLWVNSPWGRRPDGLLTQRPWGWEE